MKKYKTLLENKNNIVMYQDKQGNIALHVNTERDTLLATQDQIANLFHTQRPAITKHLRNIFMASELVENSVCSILERTAKDGKRYKVRFYNLDAIIAVGYRVNSKKATQFRIWATKVLREYLVNGYSLNKYKLEKMNESDEALVGLHEAIALIESKKHRGTLKGKITVKLTKNLVQK